MRMPTVPSSSLTEHLPPWLMDMEQWKLIVEACDSTSLQCFVTSVDGYVEIGIFTIDGTQAS